MNTPQLSLYERLGGEPAIETIVKAWYARVLEDPELGPFFQHTTMEKQHTMQHEFLCAALGGPMTYTGRPLSHAHQGRGITALHFAKFTQCLLDTLLDMGISQRDADDVISRLNAYVNEITGISY
jgi:hemoglobin